MDSAGYIFPYVAGWAKDRTVLRRNLGAIQRTSHALIGAIEGGAAIDTGISST